MATIEPTFGRQDVELQRRESCYEGFFSFERFHFRFRRFDGSWSRDVQREVFVRGSATCVLPYDPLTGSILLIEQVRAGAMLHTGSPWLLELVAGINDKDETPENLAQREAEEEAGIALTKLLPINDYFPSPGAATERVHLLCGRADLSNAGGVYGLPEEDEDIKVHVVSLDESRALLNEGRLDNAPAIIALQWLFLNLDFVNQEFTR